MKIAELQPLLDKVSCLAASESARDIYEWVRESANAANTPSMAQTVCSQVITMCHPKAWGDRYVTLFGSDLLAWDNFLGELADVANNCGQEIFENY